MKAPTNKNTDTESDRAGLRPQVFKVSAAPCIRYAMTIAIKIGASTSPSNQSDRKVETITISRTTESSRVKYRSYHFFIVSIISPPNTDKSADLHNIGRELGALFIAERHRFAGIQVQHHSRSFACRDKSAG